MVGLEKGVGGPEESGNSIHTKEQNSLKENKYAEPLMTVS